MGAVHGGSRTESGRKREITVPSSEIHRRLTRFALRLVPELFAGNDTAALSEQYCRLPDLAMTGDPEAQRFLFERDGIQFHYLPDAPLENLYRHYRAETDGRLKRSRPFVNPHYEAALAGLTHYLTLIPELLRTNRIADAMKTTGVLLHVLQDNSFGIHTLEGPGGTDVFFFDRLKLWEKSPFETLCRLDCSSTPPILPRSPVSLGNSPEEAALRIYRHWCDAIRLGRTSCVKVLLAGDADISPMTAASVLLCADVLQTILELSRCRQKKAAPLPLNEFEPYEPPGRGMETDSGQSLAFPVMTEEHLLYRFPAGIFTLLSAELSLPGDGFCLFELVNNGTVVQSGKVKSGQPVKLELEFPRNECGFRFYAEQDAVGIMLKYPEVHRAVGRTCSPPRR